MRKIIKNDYWSPTSLIILIVILSLLTIPSCQENEDIMIDDEVNLEEAFLNFHKVVSAESPRIRNWVNSRFSLKSQSGDRTQISNEIIHDLAKPSFQFCEIGFTESELEEMFGSSKLEENEDEFVGAALILYNLQINNWSSNKSVANDSSQPESVACFLEATGIAAGVGLLGALSGQLGGKAFRKAFMKAVKKIGTRFLGGFGLILVTAEFSWCMMR